ncbi:MAG: divergent polysaccharide deacetylase family protein [Alphaproteobacteria bacterium]|nr:MAG: divergent polysaccharide deacetylase family protein [Alphaproteobacteria bacterium]
MTTTPRRPLPGRIWAVLIFMVLAAFMCLVLALLLGTHLRSQGAERGGGREGYMTVVKDKAPEDSRDPEIQLGDLLDQVSEAVSSTDVSESAPMELPLIDMLPTETPPVEVSPALPVAKPQALVPLEIKPLPENKKWQSNAMPQVVTPGAPMLAIIIDDMGGQMDASTRAVEVLPAGVTLSFFPWSKPGVQLAHRAKSDGHEVMIHMPMEAKLHGGKVVDAGPDALTVGLSSEEIADRMRRNVANLADVAMGLNNHMGSRFTEWEPGMRAVLTVLQEEGMMFVDSKTAAPTAVKAASRGLDLPVLSRDVFLDHVPTPEAVRAELNKAVLLARKRGSAIAIGHPLPVTLDVLAAELPHVVSSGVVLVPVSMLIK